MRNKTYPRIVAHFVWVSIRLAWHFTCAMARWAKADFPVTTVENRKKRRNICNGCADGKFCPYCKCWLWLKILLETEKCPKDKWKECKKCLIR